MPLWTPGQQAQADQVQPTIAIQVAPLGCSVLIQVAYAYILEPTQARVILEGLSKAIDEAERLGAAVRLSVEAGADGVGVAAGNI